jgi:hypothetical protein
MVSSISERNGIISTSPEKLIWALFIRNGPTSRVMYPQPALSSSRLQLMKLSLQLILIVQCSSPFRVLVTPVQVCCSWVSVAVGNMEGRLTRLAEGKGRHLGVLALAES